MARMSHKKWVFQNDPSKEGFDWSPEGQAMLVKAEIAAFEAFKQWDPTATYVPAIRWSATARAVMGAYYAALVDAGWIKLPPHLLPAENSASSPSEASASAKAPDEPLLPSPPEPDHGG